MFFHDHIEFRRGVSPFLQPFFASLMAENTFILGFILLVDHDSEDCAADDADNGDDDQDFFYNAESRG